MNGLVGVIMFFIEETLSAFITVLSLVLTIISFLSYRKKGMRKLLYISIAFLLFFIQGLVLSAALFISSVKDNLLLYICILNTAILLILYLSVIKK